MLENDNENRSCGCNNMMMNNNCGRNNMMMNNTNMMNMDCNYTPEGINAAFGYNTASLVAEENNCNCSNNPEQCCNEKRAIREEMMQQMKCLNFAVIELSLYLNTHHDDQKAICLHREYAKQLKELQDQYQRVYGPLSIYCPCNKWRWLEEPWPWEGGNC